MGSAGREALSDFRWGTELILMVESDRSVKDLAWDMFNRFGYRILSASDDSEAIALSRKYAGKIAVVLIDIPGDLKRRGDLFQSIHEINPGAGLIATSSLPRSRNDRDMLKFRVAGYLQKPYRMTELLTMVGRVLDTH